MIEGIPNSDLLRLQNFQQICMLFTIVWDHYLQIAQLMAYPIDSRWPYFHQLDYKGHLFWICMGIMNSLFMMCY